MFGSGTWPNRNPLAPEDNGKFYTVPVKLTFASKQIAIRVTEVLKGKYKLPITTPYHKSLRACFTHVQKSVRSLNPGHQVRVNLDVKNRSLKASVRIGDKCPWELLSNTFPLPPEALDPKFHDVITINVPLFKKLRDIIFFGGENHFMSHFEGHFEGAKTFLTP